MTGGPLEISFLCSVGFEEFDDFLVTLFFSNAQGRGHISLVSWIDISALVQKLLYLPQVPLLGSL
jgi:hypothetical protein